MPIRQHTTLGDAARAAPSKVRATLVQHLDHGLAQALGQLERVDLARRILTGEFTREEYLALLQQYLILYRSLDKAITNARHLPFLNRPAFKREEIVLRDLRLLRGHVPVRTSDDMDRFHGRVLEMAEPPHAGLIGVVYALEHERRRSRRFVKALSAVLHAKLQPRNGLDLHLEGAEQGSRRFSALQTWIAENIRDQDGARDVLQGAKLVMRTLVAMHREVEQRRRSM